MIQSSLRTAVLALSAATAVGCSSAGSASHPDDSVPVVHHDRATITQEEMRQIDAASLYDIVQRLHPEWLTGRNSVAVGAASARGSASSNEVQVFLDNQRAGTADILRQMQPSSANLLRYYTASEAQARFGNGNLNGAIQIVTVKR